jgi:hypothetical protein
VRIAILIDGNAINKFHDQVGDSIFRCAPVQEARNIWVIKRCQDLALLPEFLQDKGLVVTGADELDSNLLGELAIGTNCAIDLTHASTADLFEEFVRAEAGPRSACACGI